MIATGFWQTIWAGAADGGAAEVERADAYSMGMRARQRGYRPNVKASDVWYRAPRAIGNGRRIVELRQHRQVSRITER